MKKIIFLLLIALIIFACGENHKFITDDDNPPDTTSTSSPFDGMTFGTDNSLEIMTWNLEHFPLKPTDTVSKAADIIVHLSVDIIAFQEIENASSFSQLVSKVNQMDSLNTWASYRANTAYYDINLAYIYKTNVVQKNSIYEIQELEDDYWALPRTPLVFDFNYNNVNILAIANHYKAMGDAESEARRRQASADLYSYIGSHFATKNVILLGDLNDELTDSSDDNVFQVFLDDPSHYKFADMTIAMGSSSNWSYPSWPSHLDHIMISNELFDEFANTGSTVETIKPDVYIGFSTYIYQITDHRPVALKLYF